MNKPEDYINLILNTDSYIQVFPDLNNWKKEFKEILLLIHPDRCNLNNSEEATTKLISYSKEIEDGKVYSDGCCSFKTFPYKLAISGEQQLLISSVENYNTLHLKADSNFKKYLPKIMKFNEDSLEVEIEFQERSIPLSSCKDLPQEHLNWILSRILEFCAFLDSIGYSHNGINPDSIYLVPETHGIVFVSFYHLTKIGEKLKSVSGKHSNFYPSKMFEEKISSNTIDIECAKRTVISIGGDPSGLGLNLKKKLNNNWLDFVLKFSSGDSLDTYSEYRELLNKNFEKKFYPLNL